MRLKGFSEALDRESMSDKAANGIRPHCEKRRQVIDSQGERLCSRIYHSNYCLISPNEFTDDSMWVKCVEILTAGHTSEDVNPIWREPIKYVQCNLCSAYRLVNQINRPWDCCGNFYRRVVGGYEGRSDCLDDTSGLSARRPERVHIRFVALRNQLHCTEKSYRTSTKDERCAVALVPGQSGLDVANGRHRLFCDCQRLNKDTDRVKMLRDHVKVTALLNYILHHEAVQAFDAMFYMISGGTKVRIAASACDTPGVKAREPNPANDEVAGR